MTMIGFASGLRSNKSFRLRRNAKLIKHGSHILLYDSSPFSSPTFRFLRPLEGIILSLFEAFHQEEEVIKWLSLIFGLSIIEARENIERVKLTYMKYIEEVPGLEKMQCEEEIIEEFVHTNPPCHYHLDTPVGLIWMVTPRCHARCIYCCISPAWDDESPPLSISRLEEIFCEAASLGVKVITVSGGEPFLRPDLPRVLKILVELGFKVDLSTRYPLTSPMVKRVAESGLKYIQVSVDSHKDETLSSLSGGRMSRGPTFKTLEMLQAEGIEVHVNIILLHHNLKDIPGLLEDLDRIGVRKITFSRYRRSLWRHDDAFFPSTEELKELGIKLGKKLELISEEAVGGRAICGGGRTHLVIRGDGKVSICDRLCHDRRFVVGDINRSSLREIWDLIPSTKLYSPVRDLFQGKECYSCEEFDTCQLKGFCYLNSLLCHNSPFAPDYLGSLCPPPPVRLI